MCISINHKLVMEAAERVLISNNWVALLFLFCLLILFFLKMFSAEKMKGYSLSIFNKGFVDIASQEKQPILSLFDIVFTGFSFLSISLAIYFSMRYFQNDSNFSLISYTKVATYVLIYMLLRNVIEFLLMRLLGIQQALGYFFLSKRSYLYSISIGLFFLNVVYFYGFQDFELLFTGILLLFTLRFALIVVNNKNLIIKELFYFILYLCAFEIAPLLMLFKLIR